MSSEQNSALATHLLSLERQLMDPSVRRDSERVSSLLAEDFREFGASGRIWNRDEILTLLASEEAASAGCIEDFALQQLSSQAALVTYRALRETQQQTQASLRSSLWICLHENWRMLFHQGTRIP